jgi:membrane associated rhomboid family serine protease
MLEDRDYMRQPEDSSSHWRPSVVRAWPVTVWFLILYVLVYLTEQILVRTVPHGIDLIDEYFALSNVGLGHGYVWQLVTYQFMHDLHSPLHLILNGLAIYSFGIPLERMLGQRRFVGLMLTSGIIGGILQSFVAFIWPYYFGGPVVGASACAFGLVAAFARLFPDQEITMYVLYVIPVTLRAQVLLYVLGGLAIAGFSLPQLAAKILGHVAHAAHIGGMFTGIFFVDKIVRGNWFQRAPHEPEPRSSSAFSAREEPPAPAGCSMKEVDAILDKINAKGINSLTARERQLLEQARQRIGGS